MKNYYIKKLIAVAIVLGMIISDIPVFRLDIKAESGNKLNEVITTPSPVIEEIEQETGTDSDDESIVSILEEDVSLRDEVTKYFKMSDGSMKACVYPQAVHYLKNGEYLDIDNTLEYVQVESINSEEEADEITDSAPYMSDAKGEYSSKVEVELSEGAEGYLLTYKPDEEWLYDEKRERDGIFV